MTNAEFRTAVFLDRDGTLIEDRGDLRSASEVAFFANTVHALRRFQEKFLLFIVTNQSGIAEGSIGMPDVERVNAHILRRLADAGVGITDVYVCPHNRADGCECIKPNPHFLFRAASEHHIDLRRSFVIGDHPCDVELAHNVGAQGVYLRTGHGKRHQDELPESEVVMQDIGEAAEWILTQSQRSHRSRDVRDAAGIVRRGGVVAFPTETVYGLGAAVFNPMAVARVFEIKGRPRFDPLIVHACDEQQVQSLAKNFPAEARVLAKHFWPGPLSLVLPKTDAIPDIVTAGLPTVAFRMPDHPLALELLWEVGVPIAAPSANLFGRTSPTTAAHVTEQLGNQVDTVLDGGPCRVGVESTIVSFAGKTPVLLRPGGVSLEDIEQVIGPLGIPDPSDRRPLSPGRLPQHYAPSTPLMLSPELAHPPAGKRVGLLSLQKPLSQDGFAAVEVLSESGDLRQAAASLFAALRRLDRLDLDLIVAHPVPEEGLGRAIMDRLRKASTRKHTVQGKCT